MDAASTVGGGECQPSSTPTTTTITTPQVLGMVQLREKPVASASGTPADFAAFTTGMRQGLPGPDEIVEVSSGCTSPEGSDEHTAAEEVLPLKSEVKSSSEDGEDYLPTSPTPSSHTP